MSSIHRIFNAKTRKAATMTNMKKHKVRLKHRNRRLPTSAAAILTIIISMLTVSTVQADMWFLGVGNDGYYTDVSGLRNALQSAPNPHGTPIHFRTYSNHGGSSILSDITWLADNAGPGDMAYFFYSGHGGTGSWSYDERNGSARNSYNETIGRSYSMVSDDQVAAALSAIDSRVPVVAIFDSCYAGGMTGGTDDLDSLPNTFVMMSSREDEFSYGSYPYSRFTNQLIRGIGSSLPADTNDNGTITLDEWISYARNSVYGQSPEYFDAGNFGALPIVTPEPVTASLLALGGCVTLLRRSSQRIHGRRMVSKLGRARISPAGHTKTAARNGPVTHV